MRFSLLFLAVALLVLQATPPASAFTLIEIILRGLLQNGLGRTVSTIPDALMISNNHCPCMTQIGCVLENVLVVDSGGLPVPSGECPANSVAMFSMAVNTSRREFEVLSTRTLGCIDLLNATDVTEGCGGGSSDLKHAFGTAECDACTGAGMSWCPGVSLPVTGGSDRHRAILPPTCFNASETLRMFPANTSSVYDLVGTFQSLYGSADTFGLSRDQFLNFNPTLGGCPFSTTDVPVAAPASCPADPFCPSCSPAPGGTCTCDAESPECCTASRDFWKLEDPWPATCVPDFTRDKAFWPGMSMIDVMTFPVGGDKCVLLAREWIAANLNKCGLDACTDATVDQALSDAEVWLFDPLKCPGLLSKNEGKIVQDITSVLMTFNGGLIGPPPCSEAMLAEHDMHVQGNVHNSAGCTLAAPLAAVGVGLAAAPWGR